MWGVFPEARGGNIGAVCSDFNLGECISRKAPNILLFGPFSDRAKLWYVGGFFPIYAHPNLNLSTQRQHSNLEPLD